MLVRALIVCIGAVALSVALSIPANSQVASAPATGPASAPASAFAPLAEKAKLTRSLYIKGACTIAAGDNARQPERLEFEAWIHSAAIKCQLTGKGKEIRIYDGKHAYLYDARPEPAEAVAKRFLVTSSSYYMNLGAAALAADALNGYSNLLAGVDLAAIPEEAGFDKLGPLKWFLLGNRGQSTHALLQGAKQVKLAVSPVDGLPRVLIGQHEKGATLTFVISTVTPNIAINAEEFKSFPAEAAKAKWIDADTNQPIQPPLHFIVQGK